MDSNIEKVKQFIKCPHCGYEYLPCEIMMPGDFLGKPEDMPLRDALGKILHHSYSEDPCQTESYICDGCGKQFIVEVSVSYKAKKEQEELDFTNTSVSLFDD